MSEQDRYYDVKFLDNPSKYINVSIKYLNETINGPGKNMVLFEKICMFYEIGKISNIIKIKKDLINTIKRQPNKKKLMLIFFISFLLDNNSSVEEINNSFLSTINHIDTGIHLGQKIYDKLIEIKDNRVMHILSKYD